MGFSTKLFCHITFSRKAYNSIDEVFDEIENVKRYIQIVESNIRDLAFITEPQKFCPEENDPIIWIRNKVQDALDELRDYHIKLYKLELLVQNWDKCHTKDGLAIYIPENMHWDSAFMYGDFVNSTKYPNASDINSIK